LTIVTSEYSAHHLQVLEGLEAVRKRPGMYIGSTDSRGLMHCVWEIIDNAVDEALAGNGKRIDIVLHPDSSVEVHDTGRGEVRRGAVAFHHGLTVHLARANTSDRARRVHTMIFFRDGCTRSSPFPHPSVERDGIEIGAPIAGAVTPVVWPRPVGDLPPVPAV
jgi:hypothetical protein